MSLKLNLNKNSLFSILINNRRLLNKTDIQYDLELLVNYFLQQFLIYGDEELYKKSYRDMIGLDMISYDSIKFENGIIKASDELLLIVLNSELSLTKFSRKTFKYLLLFIVLYFYFKKKIKFKSVVFFYNFVPIYIDFFSSRSLKRLEKLFKKDYNLDDVLNNIVTELIDKLDLITYVKTQDEEKSNEQNDMD